MDLRQIKVAEDDFGLMTYDPAFTNTASCRSRDHLHRRRHGHPRTPRLPDRAALRALDLPRGRLPADLRRAADRAAARPLDPRHHPPHLRARGPQEVHSRASATTRTRWGCCSPRSARSRPSTPTPSRSTTPKSAHMAARPADRQGADAGRLRLPPQHRPALRLPGQRSQLLRELPAHDVQDDRAEYEPEPGARRGRSTCSSSCTPTTSRTAPPTRCAASAPRTSTRTRPSPPASRRSTGRCTAAPTRRSCGCCGEIGSLEEHPRLHRAGEGGARSA